MFLLERIRQRQLQRTFWQVEFSAMKLFLVSISLTLWTALMWRTASFFFKMKYVAVDVSFLNYIIGFVCIIDSVLYCLYMQFGWLGSRVVSVLDSGTVGPGTWVQIAVSTLSGNSQANCSRPSCLCSSSSKISSSPLKGWVGNCRPGGK